MANEDSAHVGPHQREDDRSGTSVPNVHTKLTVILKAGDLVVAQKEDPVLWQHTLAAITGSGHEVGTQTSIDRASGTSRRPLAVDSSNDPIQRLALEIGIGVDDLQGACDPITEPPFMHLDHHCWADWVRNTPKRGRDAISPTSLAGTLLAFWMKSIGRLGPTMQEVAQTLDALGVVDRNAPRAIRNCEWLQVRDSVVRLNAARINQALEVVRSFCERRAPNVSDG